MDLKKAATDSDSHTCMLAFIHASCLQAQITDNTVTLALLRAKPLGPDYSHDLRPGMMITLLL